VQWNFISSNPHVLRGVHLHPYYDEYTVLCNGSLTLGLCDLREDSPTYGCRFITETIVAPPLQVVIIPSGVAHGLYTRDSSHIFVGMTRHWSMREEIYCQWNDPELDLPWPVENPVRSARDMAALSFRELYTAYQTCCKKVNLP
jgi:dTDP-4-dehydrorhamnose 3,5-epimerase-like enzyme